MVALSIPFGITVGLLASGVQSLGLTIQRKSHVLNQRLPVHQQRVEHRRPLWLLGVAIFLSSNILGSLVQIASLPVVILAPLGAVSLLFNALFAKLLLGDIFSPLLIVGTVFIAGGAVLIAIFGIVPEPTHSLEDLLRLFSRSAFVAYFSVLGVVVALCLITAHIVEYSLSRKAAIRLEDSPPSSPPLSPLENPAHPAALTTGVTEAVQGTLTTERTPLLDPKLASGNSSHSSHTASPLSFSSSPTPSLKHVNRARLFLALAYSSISGLLSGMCLLFAKSGVELLLLTLNGDNQFWRWQAWALLIGLVVFALAQLWYMHKALVLADPTIVCPSAFCFYNLSSIVNGLVYFDQFSLIPPLHLGLVILGIVVLLAGVWIVSINSDSGSMSDDEGEDGESLRDLSDIEDGLVSSTVVTESPSASDDEEGGGINQLSSFSRQQQPPSRIQSRKPSSPPLSHSHRHIRGSTSAHSHSNQHPHNHHHQRRSSQLRGSLYLAPLATLSHSQSSSGSPGGGGGLDDVPPLSPPLTGFQIGLSPISPGFAIRGRRVSGTSGNVSVGANDGMIRRSISESSNVGVLPSPSSRRSRHSRAMSEDGAGVLDRAEHGLGAGTGLDGGDDTGSNRQTVNEQAPRPSIGWRSWWRRTRR